MNRRVFFFLCGELPLLLLTAKQKRRKWMTLAQIFFPVFFFAILALLRLSVPREDGVPR